MGGRAAGALLRADAKLIAVAPSDGSTLGVPARACPVPAGPSSFRLGYVRDSSPVAFRRTAEAVHLVNTAASPVGDDSVSISVEVERGAALAVRSVASCIAWASKGARLDISASVEAGASLDWQLQPLIASARCDVTQRVRIRLAAGAKLHWVEEVVLGRHQEEPGHLLLGLDVELAGKPLLRQQVVVNAEGWDSPSVLGPNRAIGLELWAGDELAWPAASVPAPGAGEGWAVMALPGPGTVLSALGPDIVRMREAMAAGRAGALA